MSTAVARPRWGRLRFSFSATPASCDVTWDIEREERLTASAVASVSSASPRGSRAVVVELKPRHFTETAQHFLRVATPITWPLDEADID